MKRVTALRALLCAATLLGLTLASGADDKKADTNKDDANKSEVLSPEQFVFKASEGDLAEINLGRIASERGSSDEVKEFGRHMVEDHSKSLKELTTIADRKNFRPAQQMGAHHRELSDKLSKLEGKEFDRTYMHHMAMEHEKVVRMFEGFAKNGKDEDLKGFAEKTLPVIRKHRDMAKKHAGEKKEGKTE